MKKGIPTKIAAFAMLLVILLSLAGCVDEDAPALSGFDALFVYMSGGVPSLPGENDANVSGWGMPCKYTYVSSRFGEREDPIYGGADNHRGIDLAAPKWTPIYAVRTGEVVYAGWDDTGGGNYVSIDHGDGYKTQYMHMQTIKVSKGQTVKKGQLIGYVGSTGKSTGYHLHFAVRKWNETTCVWDYINPEQFITFD